MKVKDNPDIPKYTFKQMFEKVLYKNIHTYDDQIYMKVGKELLTASKYSDGAFSPSSACRTNPYFVRFSVKLTVR